MQNIKNYHAPKCDPYNDYKIFAAEIFYNCKLIIVI